MRKSFYFLIALSLLLCSACEGGKNDRAKQGPVDSLAEASNDSTVYGLACEGCTDSVVWILPLDAGNVIDRSANPVKYDILEAFRNHKVFGKLKTGDNIALVVNANDSTVADLVIDIEQLKGTWCYVVMPTLKDADKMTKRQQADILSRMPDSVKEAVFIPREYGFTLKRNNQASAVGQQMTAAAEKEESPVVYEEMAQYSSWRILNGRLLLSQRVNLKPEAVDSTAASKGNVEEKHPKMTMISDTADIIFMREDSLVLKFADRQQSYYRLTTESEANKILREEAEKKAKETTKKKLAEVPPAEE